MRSSNTLRLVALFEGLKGLTVLLAGTGLLALVHRDVHTLAAALITHAHLNPASKYPRIFLDASAHISDTRLLQLATGAAAYATLRLVEAYGLYRDRAWAEVLAAVSGAVYVPFEAYELWTHPSRLSLAMLLVNLAIIALMVRALQQRRSRRDG